MSQTGTTDPMSISELQWRQRAEGRRARDFLNSHFKPGAEL